MKICKWLVAIVILLTSLSAVAQDRPKAKPASIDPVSSGDAPLPGTLTQDQIKALIQKVAENDIQNDKKQRDYTYNEREMQTRLDGKGNAKSTETKTYEVLEIYGDPVQRLVAKDDKPLSSKEAAKEEAKVQKIIDKRKDESPDERRKREAKEAKDREEGMQFVREIDDAYNFTLLGTENLGGRDAWVIGAEPRPGFVPHMKHANMLAKFHGRVWVDKGDLQLAKLDVECLDTVSWGLFLARFHKGSHLMLEQIRVNDEVWLPMHVTAKIDARLALLKGINMEDEQTFSDYKKFRSDTRIVGMQELQKQQ